MYISTGFTCTRRKPTEKTAVNLLTVQTNYEHCQLFTKQKILIEIASIRNFFWPNRIQSKISHRIRTYVDRENECRQIFICCGRKYTYESHVMVLMKYRTISNCCWHFFCFFLATNQNSLHSFPVCSIHTSRMLFVHQKNVNYLPKRTRPISTLNELWNISHWNVSTAISV